MKSRYQRSTSAAWSRSQKTGPPTIVETGCSRNRNDVTIPKLPPPPRSAQKRSGLRSASAVTSSPDASTTSASMRLSIVRPYARLRFPIPPPTVNPAIPVVPAIPVGTASPNGCVAWSTSARTQPGSTRTVRASGSTRIPLSRPRSMTRPSSIVPNPAPWWPPPRTAIGRPVLAPECEGRDDVADIDRLRDQRGPSIDGAVVDASGVLVVRVVRPDQRAAERAPKIGRARLHRPRRRRSLSPCPIPPCRWYCGTLHLHRSLSVRRSSRSASSDCDAASSSAASSLLLFVRAQASRRARSPADRDDRDVAGRC